MFKLLTVASVLAVALVARPAVAAPQTDARAAARGFAQATMKQRERLYAVRDATKDPGKPVRDALHACLDDWEARPEKRRTELFAFYAVVVAAPVWVAERPPRADWVAELARIRGVGALPSLRDARRALKAQLAYVDALFAEPVDACAEVRAWRAADWGKRPPQIARIHAVRAEAQRHSRAWKKALIRGGTFIRRLGNAPGRDAHEDVWLGIGPPDALDTCDDVLLAIDAEEGFCA